MKTIIALGAETKASFSSISKGKVYVSAAMGNLSEAEDLVRFEHELKNHITTNGLVFDCIACDLHPDYRSTRLAEAISTANGKAPLRRIQHHHAHIAACMFDNGLDEEVIGVSFDGTGLGSDGALWGGEFLVCTRKDFSRRFHLKYVPQPGGDIAAREAWRMALAYLYSAYGKVGAHCNVPLPDRIGAKKTAIIVEMMQKEINSPLTSSMGRLFDAVSSLIGVCDTSEFEAEAAILLERKIENGVCEFYPYATLADEIDVSPMIRAIVEDVGKGANTGVISAKFHNTIGEMIFDVAARIHGETGIDKVLISGGCFQNKYLVGYVEKKFASSKLKLLKHKNYSPTDSSISIGQAAVALANVVKSQELGVGSYGQRATSPERRSCAGVSLEK